MAAYHKNDLSDMVRKRPNAFENHKVQIRFFFLKVRLLLILENFLIQMEKWYLIFTSSIVMCKKL